MLGIEPRHLYVLSQVHGRAWHLLDGSEDRETAARRVGDITVSVTPGVGCGVRTADCVPVLIGDRRTGAVVAVHSGWRGTADNVVAVGVAALAQVARGGAEVARGGAEVARGGAAVTGVDASSSDFVAAIGPHIERCCFEVGDDVAAELAAASKLGQAAILRPPGAQKPKVDLRTIVRSQLEEVGIPAASIDDVPGCTVCDEQRFHSYRRDHDRSGRLASVIVVRDGASPRTA